MFFVAEHIGISVQGLYKIKRGESNPSRQTLMLLREKFGLNIDWYRKGKADMLIPSGSNRIRKDLEIATQYLNMMDIVIEELTEENQKLKKESEQLKKQIKNK